MAYVTLSTFVGYSNGSGPKRASFVRQTRRLYERPARGAFDFYRRPTNAMRAGRAAGMDQEAMTALVDQAPPAAQSHFAAVADGWLHYLGRREFARGRLPEVVEAGRARWRHGDFELGVSPHLGLRKRDGRTYATWLYCKLEPLTPDVANLACWTMNEVMDDLIPGAEAMVVDVRRATPYVLGARDRARVGRWALSEVSSFLTLWHNAA